MAMGPVNFEGTVALLRRRSDALGELQGRCAQLRDARERPHAELDALVTAIDAAIDECLQIAELAAAADPAGEWRSAVTELERQLRRLAVLRSQVLALYVAPAGARCGS